MRKSSCHAFHAPRLILIAAGALSVAGFFQHATYAAAPDPQRFQLQGSGTLVPDAPIQRAAGLRLRAQLSSARAPALAPLAQTGGSFALVAYADSVAMACYNDTIFRDDFDGDGL
jgi:hypothetical protein